MRTSCWMLDWFLGTDVMNLRNPSTFYKVLNCRHILRKLLAQLNKVYTEKHIAEMFGMVEGV